eukprot:GILI01018501.1.p1 GENE.GILI01018501.1~~GILI01018501.1.p1  ORF type:complete len:530 (+),score=76.66 GILI01018501.1:47-1636(+)
MTSNHHFDAVRSSKDGFEDPPDIFANEVDDVERRQHEGRRRSYAETDDSEALQKRLNDQTQLVQDLTCQVNKLEREVEDLNDVAEKASDLEMQNTLLEEKFTIQSETIKTQQIRVNDAIRDRDLAQRQSLEDGEEINKLRKEVSDLSLSLQETTISLTNKTKECAHHVDAYETLEGHAQQLRRANGVLSERIQILEDLVDKFEKEDIGAFFTRRGLADLEAAKAHAAKQGSIPSTSSSNYVGTSTSDAVTLSSSPLLPTNPLPRSRVQGQPIPSVEGSVVTVPTPMYALDVSGTPIIPRPLMAANDRSPSASVIGGNHSHNGPYCISPRRKDGSPKNRAGSVSTCATNASINRYPVPLGYPRAEPMTRLGPLTAPALGSVSTDSAQADQLLAGTLGRGLSSPNKDDFGSPTAVVTRGGSAAKHMPPTASSTPDQKARRSLGKSFDNDNDDSRPTTPQQQRQRLSTPEGFQHAEGGAGHKGVGRGVFQTLREKRNTLKEEEERVRMALIAAHGDNDSADARPHSTGVSID